jgi:hypothetical protein
MRRLPDSHLFRIARVNTSRRQLPRLREEARAAIAMSIRYLTRDKSIVFANNVHRPPASFCSFAGNWLLSSIFTWSAAYRRLPGPARWKAGPELRQAVPAKLACRGIGAFGLQAVAGNQSGRAVCQQRADDWVSLRRVISRDACQRAVENVADDQPPAEMDIPEGVDVDVAWAG